MSKEIDAHSIILWGVDGAMGGHVKIHPRGCGDSTVVEVSLTYIGLKHTDQWLGRARQAVSEIFEKEFADMEKAKSTDEKRGA